MTPVTAPGSTNTKKLIANVLSCKNKFDVAIKVDNAEELVKTLKKEFARSHPPLSAYPATVRIAPLDQHCGVESGVLVNKRFKHILQICAHSSDMLLIQKRRYGKIPFVRKTCLACHELWKAENPLFTGPLSVGLESGNPVSKIGGRASPQEKPINDDCSEMECDIDHASLETSAAERKIAMLPTLPFEHGSTKGRRQEVPISSEQELRQRLERMQPAGRSSRFLDEVGKLIGETVKDAWEEVRHNGSAAEILSFGIEVFELAERYKLLGVTK